jgi:hypothetical protein
MTLFTFSRSESGAETRSQTFQFLIDILNQNQDVEFAIHAFFLDEKVMAFV